MKELGCGWIVTKKALLPMDKCRNVDVTGTSDAQSSYPCLKSCALYPESSGGTCGPANDPIYVLEK